MSLFYRLLYGVGFKPWENLPASPAAEQVATMFDREERGRQPPYGAALDLGCGAGIWSVRLAERGWDVTGVEIVPKAVRQARARAADAGAGARFVESSVTDLDDAGVSPGFDLVLDFGTVHGLSPEDVRRVAAGVSALAAQDAVLLMYASSPGRRGPLPRGLSREEIENAYAGWTVTAEEPFDFTGLPAAFKKTEPRWLRLRHG